jgi:ABC-type transport system involved in cytochrome bd biosynthesis fused ATPase/permease subunit
MKNSTRQYLYSVLRQASQEFQAFAKKLSLRLLRTPLPKVLIVVLGVALLISLIPLVLTLFLVFVLLKIILSLVTLALRGPLGSDLQQVRRPYRKE